jgi:hypothetical protein
VGRISRAFRLLGASWQILKSDKELLLLPLVSLFAIIVATAGIMGAGWGAGIRIDESYSPGPVDYVFLFLFYFVTYYIAIFFNAAVVGAATIRLQGGDPTVRDGLRLAWERKGKIAGWAAISATVGLILRSLEERAGIVGRIAIGIVGVAWGAITFFVVPVLLYEPVGVVEGIKRSGSIFKQRWGETFVGQGAIGLAMFLIALPLVAIGGLLAAAALPIGIAVIVLTVAVVSAVGSAMSGIFNAALYRYATTGEASGAFSPEDLGGTFRPKR